MEFLLVSILVFAASSGGDCRPSRFVDQQDTTITIQELAAGVSVTLTPAETWDVSSDGGSLAYFEVRDDSPRSTSLHVMTLPSRVIRTVSIPQYDCSGPIWSPDANSVLMLCPTDRRQEAGIVVVRDNDFRLLTERVEPESTHGLMPLAWFPDGKSVLCKDTVHLFRIDMEGKVTDKRSLAEITTGLRDAMPWQFALAPDGDSLLIARPIDEHNPLERQLCRIGPENHDWDVHMALFLHHLKSHKTEIISSAGSYAQSPGWSPDGECFSFWGLDEDKSRPEYAMFVTRVHSGDPKPVVTSSRPVRLLWECHAKIAASASPALHKSARPRG